MSTPETQDKPAAHKSSLGERVHSAVEVLEQIVANRALLVDISEEDRNRLLQAAGHVSRPDVIDRRRLLKASKRKRKAFPDGS